MVAVTLLSETTASDIIPLSFALKVAGVPIAKAASGGEAGSGIQVGGKVYTTNAGDVSALLRYAGRVGKLYPTDPEQALIVDRVLGLIACGQPDLVAINNEYLAGGKYLLGDELTVADVALLGIQDVCGFEAIRAAVAAVKNDPRVAKMLGN